MQIIDAPSTLNQINSVYRTAFELLLQYNIQKRQDMADRRYRVSNGKENVELCCYDCPAEPYCSRWNSDYEYIGIPTQDCQAAWLAYAKEYTKFLEEQTMLNAVKRNQPKKI